MSLITEFSQDHQGRTFADVMNDPRIDFNAVLVFFDDLDRQRRMIESEVHHDRPALAGVVRELETLPTVDAFFQNNDAHTTRRFRQAVGVIVRIVMEGHGWRTTGRKGSLGTRVKVAPGTTTPGAYRNSGGLATWFTRAERYARYDEDHGHAGS